MRPKIGVIGAGIMGTSHGKSVHFCQKMELIDCDFVALAETDADRRESYAAKAGVSWTTDDARAVIASPEINTVYICTPTHSHKELALDVLGRGKALFCEKPLAFNAADAREIRDAAKAAGVTHHFFEHDGVEDLSSEVLEFDSGAVVSHVSIWHNLLHRGSSRRMQVICENGQFSWEDDDWKGAIRGETNADQRFEIASDDV